jgi:hypothetical protein
LNSVIFFWKNTVFRKAAKNVVKNMFEWLTDFVSTWKFSLLYAADVV